MHVRYGQRALVIRVSDISMLGFLTSIGIFWYMWDHLDIAGQMAAKDPTGQLAVLVYAMITIFHIAWWGRATRTIW